MVLSKAIRPLPKEWYGIKDVETRLRQRYLDLILNDTVRETFLVRSRVVTEIRKFLDGRGFIEVETPMMQPIAGGAAAKPFKTHHEALGMDLFLRVAPELYLKRLLVGGFEKVYEINRNFRNEGISRKHNPEFTMLEVYQAYGDYETMMELVQGLVTTVAENVFDSLIVKRYDGQEIDLTPPWRRVTYREIVEERLGKDWFTISPGGTQDARDADGRRVPAGRARLRSDQRDLREDHRADADQSDVRDASAGGSGRARQARTSKTRAWWTCSS